MQALIDWLGSVLEWFLDVPICLYTKAVTRVVDWLLEVLTPLISDILPPGILGAVAPHMAWGLDALAIDVAIPLLFAALLTRFCIRRLPFVG